MGQATSFVTVSKRVSEDYGYATVQHSRTLRVPSCGECASHMQKTVLLRVAASVLVALVVFGGLLGSLLLVESMKHIRFNETLQILQALVCILVAAPAGWAFHHLLPQRAPHEGHASAGPAVEISRFSDELVELRFANDRFGKMVARLND